MCIYTFYVGNSISKNVIHFTFNDSMYMFKVCFNDSMYMFTFNESGESEDDHSLTLARYK